MHYIEGVIDALLTGQTDAERGFCLAEHTWFTEPEGPTKISAVILLYEHFRHGGFSQRS
jgi:hypothetical protein